MAIDAFNSQGGLPISKAQQLPTRLDGTVFRYWEGLSHTTKSNFQEVKALLKLLFGRHHVLHAFQNLISARPRLPMEPLEVYRSELQGLVEEAFPDYNTVSKNGELYRRFLAGFDAGLHAKIIEHGAKDIDSALSKAQQIEEAGTCAPVTSAVVSF